jgi:hypothetical protein
MVSNDKLKVSQDSVKRYRNNQCRSEIHRLHKSRELVKWLPKPQVSKNTIHTELNMMSYLLEP